MENNVSTILEALRLVIGVYRDLNDIELNNAAKAQNDILVSFYTGYECAYKNILTSIMRLENKNNG